MGKEGEGQEVQGMRHAIAKKLASAQGWEIQEVHCGPNMFCLRKRLESLECQSSLDLAGPHANELTRSPSSKA